MEPDSLASLLEPLLEATGATIVPPGEEQPDDVVLEHSGAVLHIRLPHLDGALDRLISVVERDLGAPLPELGREDKQQAVARLHALGAFNLRKSVEDIAKAVGVSRFTVYNYLDRIDQG